MPARPIALLCLLLSAFQLACRAAETVSLADTTARLEWTHTAGGWRITTASVLTGTAPIPLGTADGQYTIIYSPAEPPDTPTPIHFKDTNKNFPEAAYKFIMPARKKSFLPAMFNLVGEQRTFFPSSGTTASDGSRTFTHSTDVADISARWTLDPAFPGDICVTLSLTARKAGWFSMPTPALATVAPSDLKWAVVPGYFKGSELNPDIVLSLCYGHGLPNRPVIVGEGSASTLASIITNKSGITLAVIAEPGLVDPLSTDKPVRERQRLGLSHMTRGGKLSPTLYRPILGGEDSKLAVGETLTLRYRYSLRSGAWFAAIKHAAEDIYAVQDFLALKKPVRSLSQRLRSLHAYVADNTTSLWHTEQFSGKTIGAQAYNGGVVGANRDRSNPADYDAMKNSDYGAMWMLARLTRDPRLVNDRLPFARNFKLAQQQSGPGFFQGAALGQYYLAKSKRFTEEWGDYVEPVALTYYTMLDIGNILLFEPDDAELRERLRLGADRLLAWQHADGHWEIAYDHATQNPLFTELPDYRPTFYGLLVAYKILGDKKYLNAARRGADWLIEHAVKPARFVGVCGDARFAADFATVQIAQGLLDLHELTGDTRYRDAAIETARQYVTEVFTHPRATTAAKVAGKIPVADWQINQTGLAFEHGGTIGSANGGGPILLASYAGLYIRMAQITGEKLFADLARAAVLARDSFLDPKTQVASYYWSTFNRGPGAYPHHAWWQIGWITDYLVSEVQLRSGAAISFPRGFITPKVGPHACFGFAPGKINGTPANLTWLDVDTGRPEIDYLTAESADKTKTYVILLNNSPRPITTDVKLPVGAPSRKVVIAAWGIALLTLENAASATAPELNTRNGLPHTRAKIAASAEVRVAFLGGSITAAKGWRVHTLDILRREFSDARFSEIFAAVSGTGSNYGACRLERDVLSKNPDLVFVEFAVNDGGTPDAQIEAQMEGIVRQVRRKCPDADICFVYTLTSTMLAALQKGRYQPSAQAMESVATHYGIPSIHFGVEVARRASDGTLIFYPPESAKADANGNDAEGRIIFTRDKTHPTDAGHRVYAVTLARTLPVLLRMSAPANIAPSLPPPLHTDNWENAKLVILPNADKAGAWRKLASDDPVAKQAGQMAPPIWVTFTAGAAVEFRFKGTRFGIIGLKGSDNGKFRCTIDEKPVATDTLFDAFSTPGRHPLKPWFYSQPLAEAEHHVRIELLPDTIDKAAIIRKPIDPNLAPNPYASHGLYLCGLLITGEPLSPPVFSQSKQ